MKSLVFNILIFGFTASFAYAAVTNTTGGLGATTDTGLPPGYTSQNDMQGNTMTVPVDQMTTGGIPQTSAPTNYFDTLNQEEQNKNVSSESFLSQIVPLNKLGLTEGNQPLNNLLNQLFYVGLVAAVILAIVMIIRGGVEYMTIDAITSKENGKNRVKAALGGLLLAFSAILILNTINPGLTSLNIVFEPLKNIQSINIFGGVTSGTRVGTDANGNPIYVPSTPSGEGEINPSLTAYSPQGEYDSMEGGYASSKAGLDGKFLVRTLDDYANGTSPYVTLAGDPSLYGKSYIIPQITYKNESGQTITLNNVKGYVHDTGSAFTGQGSSRIDIPVGKNYSSSALNGQPFSKQTIKFIPAK